LLYTLPSRIGGLLMAEWYVKDLSRLTGVSVQTLHHYDRIGILKPSTRDKNGYRLYSKKDLLSLKRIMALKYFGFSLAQIKTLLKGDANIVEHFSVQARLQEQEAQNLLEVSHFLKDIMTEIQGNEPVPWQKIIKSMEVYKMTNKLKKPWLSNIVKLKELKQYQVFAAELKNNQNEDDTLKRNWAQLLEEIQCNLNKGPKSPRGICYGEEFMVLINGLYAQKYGHLDAFEPEKDFTEVKELTPDIFLWLETAVRGYWQFRIYYFFNKIGVLPNEDLLEKWQAVLDTFYVPGEHDRKQALRDLLVQDKNIGENAKQWLSENT
jgi:DNA-binding transcriptional MerR regulator